MSCLSCSTSIFIAGTFWLIVYLWRKGIHIPGVTRFIFRVGLYRSRRCLYRGSFSDNVWSPLSHTAVCDGRYSVLWEQNWCPQLSLSEIPDWALLHGALFSEKYESERAGSPAMGGQQSRCVFQPVKPGDSRLGSGRDGNNPIARTLGSLDGRHRPLEKLDLADEGSYVG